MKPPIVITTSDPDAAEPVVKTVWHAAKAGTPGALLYTQQAALAWLGEGYDIEAGTVVRLPQGWSAADYSEWAKRR